MEVEVEVIGEVVGEEEKRCWRGEGADLEEMGGGDLDVGGTSEVLEASSL